MSTFTANTFDILESEKEFRDINLIKKGCTLPDAEPRKLFSCKNYEDAIRILNKFESLIGSEVDENGRYFYVKEYAIEAYETNEDGEYINGSAFIPAEFSDYSLNLLELYKELKK